MFSLSDELPLQLYHVVAEGVRCYRSTPSDHLRSYIYYYWWLEVAPGKTNLEVIPDNAVDLVMSPEIAQFSILYLPVSEKFSIPLNGPMVYVGVSFRVERISEFFNVSLNSMGEFAPGEETTFGLCIESVTDGLNHIDHPDQLASALDEMLLQRLHESGSLSTKKVKLNVDKALTAMQASVGRTGMECVAEQFDLSDRQFRRIMVSLFGYGPKKVQRIMRLQKSLRELFNADDFDADEGFFDQAHKINEVRALTGLTPGQIKKMAEIYNSMN